MVLKIRMLTSQCGPRVNRAFGQIVDVAAGEMDLGEARRLVDGQSAEIATGDFPEAKDKPKQKPETAAVAVPENAAKRTGTAPRRRGRPRKKKETSS